MNKITPKLIKTWQKEGYDCVVFYNVSRELYLQYSVHWLDTFIGETNQLQFGHCYDLEYAKPFNFKTAIRVSKLYKKYCEEREEIFRIYPFKRSLSKWTMED